MVKYPGGSLVSRGMPINHPTKRKPKRRGPGPEHVIQTQIIAMLSLNGCQVWRINVGKVPMKDGRFFSAGPQAGFPDICGYRKSDGKMFFIEVKTRTGKRRPAQEYFAKSIADDPVIYGVARSPEEALEVVQQGLNRTEDVR